MRWISTIPEPTTDTVRLMIYSSEEGAYLFGYTSQKDGPCKWDEWYETEVDALDRAREKYGVNEELWEIIDDPQPGCRHDWIEPILVD